MKDRFKMWDQIAASVLPPKPAAPRTARNEMVKVIRLTGFQQIEDKILLAFGRQSHEVDDLVDLVSKETFGITYTDTLFERPRNYRETFLPSDEDYEIDDRWHAHEEQFETEGMPDDYVVEHLKELGIDFTDDKGQPLRCTTRFCRQAEAAAKGIMGKMPDPATGSLERLKDNLEEEARRFMHNKRRA